MIRQHGGLHFGPPGRVHSAREETSHNFAGVVRVTQNEFARCGQRPPVPEPLTLGSRILAEPIIQAGTPGPFQTTVANSLMQTSLPRAGVKPEGDAVT